MSNTPSAYIEATSARLLSTLRQLVAFETVNPPGRDYDAITRWLEAELADLGLKASRLRPASSLQRRLLGAEGARMHPRSNVLGLLRVPGATRTLHFNAHFDVVPVGEGWRHGSPFSGAVERGWIHGRGTADMKGSIASLLLALRALRATGTRPLMNIEVSFTADEETDSELGAGWLVKHAPIHPDYVVVMEGGEDDCIGCGHNGVVWLEVTVHGQAAHGSRPELGINALEKMSALVLGLAGAKRRLEARSFRSPDGRVMHPTLNLGGVFSQGPGGKINTVPALARFSVDRRVLPTERLPAAEKELRGMLQDAARRIPGCRISIAKVSENFPCYSDPDSPFFKAMAASVSRMRRRPAGFGVSTGFNDMAFFRRDLGVPTLGYGPGGRNEHGTDERARIADLLRCARIYADLMTSFAGE